MSRMIERASDRLASRFIKRMDAGACYAQFYCYCKPSACPYPGPCHGNKYSSNCAGTCVYVGYC